jgi:FkbM family methyltransferase
MSLSIIVKLLGKKLAWRLGRGLYMQARGEIANAIETNGEAALIRTVVSAGSPSRPTLMLWDVGGNLGEWSQIAVDATQAAGKNLRLDIFEPAPVARAGLESRFGAFANVQVHGMALSDHIGTGKMEIVAPTGGTNALVADGAQGSNLIDVSISTGAAMMDMLALDHLDLVKVDAEGFDFAILTGVRPVLEAGRISVIQFEYNHRWLDQRNSLHSVFRFVEDLPYHVARVTPDGLEIYPHWNPELDRFFETNYALVHKDVADRVGARMGRWDESNVFLVD